MFTTPMNLRVRCSASSSPDGSHNSDPCGKSKERGMTPMTFAGAPIQANCPPHNVGISPKLALP